jgi:hypothetical protein
LSPTARALPLTRPPGASFFEKKLDQKTLTQAYPRESISVCSLVQIRFRSLNLGLLKGGQFTLLRSIQFASVSFVNLSNNYELSGFSSSVENNWKIYQSCGKNKKSGEFKEFFKIILR